MSGPAIAIVDHGMGNLGSVQNMVKRLGGSSVRTANRDEIAAADKIILAGIGGFDGAMERLQELRVVDVLTERALGGRTPVLGVCLGMQLMAHRSAEGEMGGLGWLDAEVKRFQFDGEHPLPVPHMGWEIVEPKRPSPLFELGAAEPRFYFSHAYHVVCHDPDDIAATADYGGPFVAAIHRGNLLGTQFHPEKSHVFGMDVYRRFLALPT
jgi:glutamine amidotransferase